MSSEEISVIATEPFIQKFVFAIIQNIRARNFVYEEKQIIHTDLVPKISARVMHASLGEKKATLTNNIPSIMDKKKVVPKIPIAKPNITHAPTPLPVHQQSHVVPKAPAPPKVVPLATPENVQTAPGQSYDQITLLLNDPSVSAIECQGAGKPLMVIRMGQRQITKIVFSAEGIKEILDRISETAHIPLLEGVFRAAVDNFSINAVISEIIGSKFIIKKQVTHTAPSMGGNYGR